MVRDLRSSQGHEVQRERSATYVSTGWKIMSSMIPAEPDPRTRAVPESFPPDGGGDIVACAGVFDEDGDATEDG